MCYVLLHYMKKNATAVFAADSEMQELLEHISTDQWYSSLLIVFWQ